MDESTIKQQYEEEREAYQIYKALKSQGRFCPKEALRAAYDRWLDALTKLTSSLEDSYPKIPRVPCPNTLRADRGEVRPPGLPPLYLVRNEET